MIKLFLAAACLASGLAGAALAQAEPQGDDPAPTDLSNEAQEGDDAPTTLTVIPEEVVRGETAPVITVPGIAVGTITLESGPGADGSVSVGAAMEAAVKSGFLGQLLSGQPYTIFVPTNAALDAVPQDALAQVFDDEAQIAPLIQGYVIEGNVNTDAALALAREAGGQVTVESIEGSPVVIAVEGDELTVNGARVVVPNLGYASLVIHVIDGAFLPGQPAP